MSCVVSLASGAIDHPESKPKPPVPAKIPSKRSSGKAVNVHLILQFLPPSIPKQLSGKVSPYFPVSGLFHVIASFSCQKIATQTSTCGKPSSAKEFPTGTNSTSCINAVYCCLTGKLRSIGFLRSDQLSIP